MGIEDRMQESKDVNNKTKNKYFVYLYRDSSGNPVYVGQGKEANRATSHKVATHNDNFGAWLRNHKNNCRVEIIGPLEDKTLADAVETAVISALSPMRRRAGSNFFNVSEGRSSFRFRSFGVPDKYADRIANPIGGTELKKISRQQGTLMFVRINQIGFEDGRVGYDLAVPPSDPEIRERIERWWQVKKKVPDWVLKPTASPAILVAVTGAPGAQVVIASAFIDRRGWASAESGPYGVLKVPLQRKGGLDAAGLRGRPIAEEVGLRFTSFRNGQFIIRSTRDF